ncbi:hypothetical protein LINPERPRIM_LOCUS40951 [Linum perenne]
MEIKYPPEDEASVMENGEGCYPHPTRVEQKGHCCGRCLWFV